jgi:hypothetical protein
MSFTIIVNNFKAQLYAIFIDLLAFLVCIVIKLFCKFISFLWNRVMIAGKVLLCDKCNYIFTRCALNLYVLFIYLSPCLCVTQLFVCLLLIRTCLFHSPTAADPQWARAQVCIQIIHMSLTIMGRVHVYVHIDILNTYCSTVLMIVII